MSGCQNIQWFPGHMTKTIRNITSSISLVDCVAELVDARIPISSRNPELAGIVSKKPLIILLSKSDIADPNATKAWINYYKSQNIIAIPVDCKSGKGIDEFAGSVKHILSDKLEEYKTKGMVGKPLRVMIVGIPNVGKSSFINRIAKNAKAKVEDRPGVTRGNQWFKIDRELDLLDTPGVLWPKFEDQTVGEHLAFTGAIKDTVMDIESLAFKLCEYLEKNYCYMLEKRYSLEEIKNLEVYKIMEQIGKKRGMVVRGGEIDFERVSNMLLDEFRAGKIGKITIELP